MPDIKRTCPICGAAELTLWRSCCLPVARELNGPVLERLELDMYICPACRYVAPFAPLSQEELLRQEQDIVDPVEKFKYRFRNYTDQQLQKVAEGRGGYVPDAQKAAKELLLRRGRGE
mgnify:FL=1